MRPTPGAASGQHLKTLDRGLRLLELLAETPGGMSVPELTSHLGSNRAIVYRLLKTLGEHRLVSRESPGRYRLGTGLLALARSVSPHLQEVASPHLARLADAVRATAYLIVADGDDAVVAMTAAPSNARVHVSYPVGLRHALSLGAGGVAILASRTPHTDDRSEVVDARAKGYASTFGDLTPGLHGLAAAIVPESDGQVHAAIGAVTFGEFDIAAAAPEIKSAARAVATALAEQR